MENESFGLLQLSSGIAALLLIALQNTSFESLQAEASVELVQ